MVHGGGKRPVGKVYRFTCHYVSEYDVELDSAKLSNINIFDASVQLCTI